MTRKRVPTVNRAQFTSIFMDEDYKAAVEYADAYQRTVYEAEATAIDEIQKGILAISQNEEPFDVFICYKETGADGRRTRDSVLANDLYHQLTQEGFKVFFARITLEDKLGQEYEPYIFAALNSAKVMVVLGTKPEHFNAVWVKNEWSRYLMLIRNGAKKTLIPAYRDMDPYDLPEEFSHLQAQDMNKLGFMQDLIRGIKKITDADKEKPVVNQTTVINNNSAVSGSVAPLLKRAFMFLEDGEWDSANEYAEKVLDLDPECARAYVVKLLAERKIRTQAQLHFSKAWFNEEKLFKDPIETNQNYKKAVRFADGDLKRELKKDAADNAEEYDRRRYEAAKAAMNRAVTDNDFNSAAQQFDIVSYYLDAAELAKQCRENAKEYLYQQALSAMNAAVTDNDFNNTAKLFDNMSGYCDSKALAKQCRENAKEYLYPQALSEMDSALTEEQFLSIAAKLEKLGNYRDSAELLRQCKENAEFCKNNMVLRMVLRLSSVKAGDIIKFGMYEWYIIRKSNNTGNNTVTLLCKDIVAEKPYDEERGETTWEKCTLRKWLNEDFYSRFTDEEKAMIARTKCENKGNSKYGTYGGNDTEDYIFLLSLDEAGAVNESMRAVGLRWWLRSPGWYQNHAAYVYWLGPLSDDGWCVCNAFGVRPALNLKFKSFKKIKNLKNFKEEQERQRLEEEAQQRKQRINHLTRTIAAKRTDLQQQRSIYNANTGKLFGKKKAQAAQAEINRLNAEISKAEQEKAKVEAEMVKLEAELKELEAKS